MDKQPQRRIERVTFSRHGTPTVQWSPERRRPGETTTEFLMRVSRDPIRGMDRDEAVRAEVVKLEEGRQRRRDIMRGNRRTPRKRANDPELRKAVLAAYRRDQGRNQIARRLKIRPAIVTEILQSLRAKAK